MTPAIGLQRESLIGAFARDDEPDSSQKQTSAERVIATRLARRHDLAPAFRTSLGQSAVYGPKRSDSQRRVDLGINLSDSSQLAERRR